MQITGTQLIGGQDIPGTGAAFHAYDPATGETLEPAWHGADASQVDRAARLAEAIPEERARLLAAIEEALG